MSNEIILSDTWIIKRLSNCVSVINKVEAKNKKTGEIYYKDKTTYHSGLYQALKHFLNEYAADRARSLQGVADEVKNALEIIEQAEKEIKDFLNETK